MEIQLTQGRTALIDDEDYERVSKHGWVIRKDGYAHAYINKKSVLLHRFIADPGEGVMIDHINMDRLDNRKVNLRPCTQSQNRANVWLSIRNKTGYKGVDWNIRVKKYHAQIKVDGKKIHLGYFDDKIEAAKAYDKAALIYFGEFSRINGV